VELIPTGADASVQARTRFWGRGVTGAVRYVLGQGRDPKTGALKELMPGDDSRVEWIGGTGFGFRIETAADADLGFQPKTVGRLKPCSQPLWRAHPGVIPSTGWIFTAAISRVSAIWVRKRTWA
jgi:hypothetical protein